MVLAHAASSLWCWHMLHLALVTQGLTPKHEGLILSLLGKFVPFIGTVSSSWMIFVRKAYWFFP